MGFIEMGIIDIIDILLVALLLYYVYKFIKGSQATSIIVGLLMIYVLLIVVKALNMEMLSAILSSVTSVGLIAIFIIFQPEIRRFLKGFGEQSSNGNPLLRRLFGKTAHEQHHEVIDPLVRACEDMSASKTGALIVLTQSQALSDVVETGVKIDAIISPSLLKNLFFKNSPLHDGAVIITGSRIVAAKCVLPSTQSEVPLSFGMRHRAAMGLSEMCDAVVVVVSEETGTVSIAHEGKVNSGLSATELKAELMKYTTPAEEKKR